MGNKGSVLLLVCWSGRQGVRRYPAQKMGGRAMVGPVVIVPYDADWVLMFERIRDFVSPALGGITRTIEHVGSTSVPGLAAKPIIDIDVVVATAGDVPLAIQLLASLGYQHQGDLGIAGREAFIAPQGLPPHHLYVCSDASPALRKHLLFRNYLRMHSAEAKAYAQLKMALAQRYVNDRESYTEGKTEFINARLNLAGWE